MAEPNYRSVARSIFGGVLGGEPYDLIISYNDVVDFLILSISNPAIGFVFNGSQGRARV
jgi:hypothetical protein